MPVIKFPIKPSSNEPPFFSDIREEGYHVYSLDNAKKPGFYPPELPDYSGVPLSDLKEDDIITIRVFFRIGSIKDMRVDGGHIDLRVEFVDEDKVTAAITTQLPKEFALKTGDSIEVFEDEILYKQEKQYH